MSTGPTKERLAELFENGADSIVIRASRRDGAGFKDVKAYQVIIKKFDATKAWGVGCMANPVTAFDRAFDAFFKEPAVPTSPATAVKKARRKGLLS